MKKTELLLRSRHRFRPPATRHPSTTAVTGALALVAGLVRIAARPRSLAVALVTALGAGLLAAVPTSAAIGDRPLITWNMQGSNSDSGSKWTFDIGGFLNGWSTPPILALQEAGSQEPPRIPGTQRELLGAGQLAALPADLQAQLPPYAILPTGPNVVRHTQWYAATAHAAMDVYFLQTDPNGDSWGGGRVNLAMVTERAADEVAIVPNPLGQTTAWAARATLGVRFGNTWYFTVHALSRSGGSDAPGLLANISRFVTSRGQNEDWVALGDWNRDPGTMQGRLPAGAQIYSTGQTTQRSGGELDWAVYSNGAVNGVNVQLRPTASSDHTPVQIGTLQAAAEPTPLFSSYRAIESMAAGGVLDGYYDPSSSGATVITSHTRNGSDSQSWQVEQYTDTSIRFVGEESDRCIGLSSDSTSNSLVLDDCTNDSRQRWFPEYLGNNEYQLHSAQDANVCMNIEGGQTDPGQNRSLIGYACQNTPNERWIFTPAEATTDVDLSPTDLSHAVLPYTTLENMKAGGIMDANKNGTANGTAIVSYHRTGGGNQGWDLLWPDNNTVTFKGSSSGRCVDTENSGQNVGPGSTLALYDCNDQDSQKWHPEQLTNGQVLLHSVKHPDLCMDIKGGPTNPNDGNLILWNCSGSANQQWLFTSFDPSGSPDPRFERDQSELISLPDPGVPAQRTAYYPSWSVYANNFFIKNLDTEGIAGKLTTLNYAFENIDPVNLTCLSANKAGSSDESDTTGNDGASDAWADYQMGFTADNSVDGSEDAWDQPLKGNFNQLKQLKAKYPNLKVLVSLGGWTYSKYFSDAAATDASRKKFVSSCIDMYIKGNLPVLDGSPAGGQGVAAGVFDGFDIDWEFPASADGHAGNHYAPEDTANFTALLQEFRTQLDALGGKHYRLTAALPAGSSNIDQIQVGQVASALDMGDVMAYDMHGAWETAGPTNFQSPLYDSSASPASGTGLTANDAINHYLQNGFPPSKLTLGVPFYGRGWTGVPEGGNHGLYQSVTGATDPFPYSQSPGVAMYKELEDAGKLADTHYDPTTNSSWVYDGSNFWSIETAQSLTAKRQYIKDKGLAGIMIYSLEADDSATTLLNAATGFTS
jgi:GH18 family chitinase